MGDISIPELFFEQEAADPGNPVLAAADAFNRKQLARRECPACAPNCPGIRDYECGCHEPEQTWAGYQCVACLRHFAELVDGDVCAACAPHWYARHYAREEWPDAVKVLCGEHPAVPQP